MRIAEVFGFGTDNQTEDAWNSRDAGLCPFRDSACTKSSRVDPIGVCSLTDGNTAASLCPVRFIERDVIFHDAARFAFGENARFAIFPEFKVLRIEPQEPGGPVRKIGKVDYLLGHIEGNQIVNFCAMEVQAVYFSGESIRPPLRYYMEHRELDVANSDRRPDFRSSAQKRLMPQLQLKVPVFRRWGRRFFVVVDSQFFNSLPQFPAERAGAGELTWLIYPIERAGENYELGNVRVVHSQWEQVGHALRVEGTPPTQQEVVQELQGILNSVRNVPRILRG